MPNLHRFHVIGRSGRYYRYIDKSWYSFKNIAIRFWRIDTVRYLFIHWKPLLMWMSCCLEQLWLMKSRKNCENVLAFWCAKVNISFLFRINHLCLISNDCICFSTWILLLKVGFSLHQNIAIHITIRWSYIVIYRAGHFFQGRGKGPIALQWGKIGA